MFAIVEKRPNSVNTAPGCREFTVTAFPIYKVFLRKTVNEIIECFFIKTGTCNYYEQEEEMRIVVIFFNYVSLTINRQGKVPVSYRKRKKK